LVSPRSLGSILAHAWTSVGHSRLQASDGVVSEGSTKIPSSNSAVRKGWQPLRDEHGFRTSQTDAKLSNWVFRRSCPGVFQQFTWRQLWWFRFTKDESKVCEHTDVGRRYSKQNGKVMRDR